MSRLRHNLPGKFIKIIFGLGAILLLIGLGLFITRPPDLGPASVALSTDPPATIPPLLSAFPTLNPTISLTSPTLASLAPSASPTPVIHAATRIVFTRARVDLPIITAPTNEKFPYCDVAERMAYYNQPGQGGVVYLYAHSTHYMFGGLLAASWRADSYLLGQQIQIYTADDLVYTYAVTEIHRHQAYNSFSVANTLVGEALILQACENNNATGPKLIVVARPVSVKVASHAAAHPPTHPRVCAHGY
jgi:hypothetical protein